MAQPVTFEEAMQRMRQENPHASEGTLLKQMRDWHDAGDPEIRAIPDIEGKLKIASLSGLVHGLVTGAAETIDQPIRGLAQMVGAETGPGTVHDLASGIAQRFSPQNIAAYKSQAEPGFPEEAGEVAGQGVGIGLSAAALGPFGKALPVVGKMGGIFGQAGRGMAEMAALQKMGALGDMPMGEAIKWGYTGPVVGKALGAVVGPIVRRFGAKAAEAVEEPAAEVAGERAPEPAEAVPEKPASPFQPRAVLETPLTRQGEYNVPPKPSPVEHVGLNVRKGQPFEIKTSVRMRTSRPGLDIWGDPRNPAFGEGKPYPASFDRPMVIDVPNSDEEGWVHAAESLYADNTKALNTLRESSDRIGLAQEMVARKAKSAGFDSIALNTPAGPEGNVFVGLKDWKPTPHPDITKEFTQFRKKPVKPQGPFVQAQPKLGDQIASEPRPEAPTEAIGKQSQKAKTRMIRKVKEPNPLVHASGDPDLIDQVKKEGAISGNPGAMEPETLQARSYINRRSRSSLSRIFPQFYASDEPKYQRAHLHTLTEGDVGEVWANKWMEFYKGFREKFGKLFTNQEQYDELARAVDGLGHDFDQKRYVQEALNVDSTVDKAARQFVQIRDAAYTRGTENDPRVPYILEHYGLSHNRAQLERLRAMQEFEGAEPKPKPSVTGGGFVRPWSENHKKVYEDILSKTKAPTDVEHLAAQDLQGMLKFDFTHDLDFEPLTGFLRITPAANEKGMLEASIRHLAALEKDGAGLSFEDKDRMEDMLKRLNYIEGAAEREVLRREPARDFIPKKKWASIVHVSKDPAARPFYFDTNPDHIVGTYLTSHNNKRIADVALAYARDLIRDPNIPASLKTRTADWANIVRGATGFRADARFTEVLNNAMHSMGLGEIQFSPHEVHKMASTVQDYMRMTMLELTPFRFPFINLTHTFPTTYAVAGAKYFGRGFAKVMADPQAAFRLATEDGIIGHDSETFKEISGRQSWLSNTTLMKALRAPTWITENLRKAHAYQVGLEMAKDGQYSKVVRGFVNDPKEYANTTQMQKAYARAFVKTTQFELSNVEKAPIMVGGPPTRLIAQFKSWPSNLGGLYVEMLRQKDYRAFARGITSLAMLGGGAAIGIGGSYDFVRNILLRHGYNLPDKPGYAYVGRMLGLHDTELNVPTLSDPFGTTIYNPTSLLGPAIGKAIDTITMVKDDMMSGRQYKIPKDLIGMIGPEAGAMIQSYEELVQGGVFGNGGVLTSNRPLLGIVMRGVDLQPSVGSQRKKYEQDIENAMLAKDPKNVQDILAEMQRRGFVLDAAAQRRIRAFVYQHKKGEVTPWQWY